MLMQRVAFLLAVAHAAARPAGPKARALPRQQAAQRRKGWTAKLKFLRDDWQEAVLRPRGGASSKSFKHSLLQKVVVMTESSFANPRSVIPCMLRLAPAGVGGRA